MQSLLFWGLCLQVTGARLRAGNVVVSVFPLS